MSTQAIPTAGAAVEMTAADFIALPNKKSIVHRGVPLSRTTLWRAIKRGDIKTKLFRQPGSVRGRRFLLVESLNGWLNMRMVDVPLNPATEE